MLNFIGTITMAKVTFNPGFTMSVELLRSYDPMNIFNGPTLQLDDFNSILYDPIYIFNNIFNKYPTGAMPVANMENYHDCRLKGRREPGPRTEEEVAVEKEDLV